MKNARAVILDICSKLRNEQGAGFTVLELVFVIAILGTLAAIALPVYSHQIEKAKITRAIAEIRMIEKAIISYRINSGSSSSGQGGKKTVSSTNDLPDSLADIGHGNLMDPWGTPYQFANHANISPGARRKYKSTVPLNTDYDLYSMGPDGKTTATITATAGYDDVIRASDGEYIGPASEY